MQNKAYTNKYIQQSTTKFIQNPNSLYNIQSRKPSTPPRIQKSYHQKHSIHQFNKGLRMQTFIRHTPTTITSNNSTKSYTNSQRSIQHPIKTIVHTSRITHKNSSSASEPSKQPPRKPPPPQTSRAQ